MIHLGRRMLVFVASLTLVVSCQNEKNTMTKSESPVAKKVPKELIIHDDTRVDDYYWLNDRDDAEVIAHLEKEDAYYDKLTAHTKAFQSDLFEEMKARIKEDDSSVPYKQNGYWYVTRYETGKEYPIYSRHKGTLDAPEEIMFNCNEMAEGHEFFNLGGIAISPDNKLASFGTDTISRRLYTIQIKDLETGEIYPDKINNSTGGSVWGNDNKTLFYTKKDPVTLRSNKIYSHKFKTDTAEDKMVYHEKDETFGTYVYKSKSK